MQEKIDRENQLRKSNNAANMITLNEESIDKTKPSTQFETEPPQVMSNRKRSHSVDKHSTQRTSSTGPLPPVKKQTRSVRPREKIKSQLESITPMQIERTRQFYPSNTFLLRDQIEAYVAGFPATKQIRKTMDLIYGVEEQDFESDSVHRDP